MARHGPAAERVVAMADLTNEEAIAYVQDRFRRMGVERALARAGALRATSSASAIELEYIEGVLMGADVRQVVVKVGTSSITTEAGELDDGALLKLCAEIAERTSRARGRARLLGSHRGRPARRSGCRAPDRHRHAAGRRRRRSAAAHGADRRDPVRARSRRRPGALTPHDFVQRSQYLHARETLRRLLDLGVLPIVNENDTVADDEIRYGDNDRLAALVSHLVGADVLVLLTDTPGLFTADPRLDAKRR